jgi:secreted Zn-dependent insulinase-like peptidase
LQANLLAFPLLKPDAISREIEAVNEEFEANFPNDSVRSELLLSECSGQAYKDFVHPCAKFGWGNKESLNGENKETLWEDVKKFH